MNCRHFFGTTQLYVFSLVVSTLFAAGPNLSVAQEGLGQLEEITVTARRREETLQDTPIAVSAFSGERLEDMGITMVTRLQEMTPNLVFQNTPTNSGIGTNAVMFIRGVGQKDFAPTTDPGVGVYIDGVFLARTVGSVFDMIDLDQVEVLRGPQGTLYGRNTIGGAILLTTKKPNEIFSGQFDAKYGTDNRLNVRGAINVPLAENFFMRASAAVFQQDGYVTRPFDGLDLGDQDDFTGRIAFRWLPTETITVDFAAEYGEFKTNGHAIVVTRVDTPDDTPDSFVTGHNAFAGADANGLNPYNCWVPGAPDRCYNNDDIGGKSINYGSGPNFSDIETHGETLTIEWQATDNITVTSITALRGGSGDFAVDGDAAVQTDGEDWFGPGGPVVNPLSATYDTWEQDQLSQEITVGGLAFDGRLQWLTGVYYFEEDGENLNPVDFFPVSIQSGGYFDYQSKAIFAQFTYNITDPWTVTAGLRYTDDDRDYTPDQYFEELPLGPLGFPCFDPAFHIPCEIGDRVLPYEVYNNSSTETTPLLSTAYEWTDAFMTYLSYSEGYKNGGFTQRIFPPEPSLPAFGPEFVKSYEFGLKSDFLEGAMRVNAAVFYMDYTDMQLLVSDASRIGPFTTNAGDAVMKGAELELNWIPAESWRIDASVGYLDPSYETLLPGALAAGLTLDSPFTLISDWNLNGTVQKTFTLENGSTLVPFFNWSYRSGFYTNANGLPFRDVAPPLYQSGYHLFNASLRWNSPDGKVFVTGGVDNIGDKEYRTFGDYQPGFGMDQESFDRGTQWYVMAGYSF